MKHKPLYQTVADTLEERIRAGRLRAGDAVGSESELEKEFGVSNITVRRALNDLEQKGLIERRRGKGSFVRPFGREPRAEGPEIVSLVVPFDATMELAVHMLRGIAEVLAPPRFVLNVVNSENDDARERELLLQLRKTARGILLYPISAGGSVDVLAAMAAARYPVVLLDKKSALPVSSVCSDNRTGARRMTERLLEAGHRRIAYLGHTGSGHASTVADRFMGFCEAMQSYGLEPDFDIVFFAALPDAMLCRRLRETGVTAAVCDYDELARALYAAARESGISIPEDLSVTGFDDLSFAPHLTPPLATVRQDMVTLGRKAAEIMKRILDGNTQPEEAIIPTEVRMRESVCPPSEQAGFIQPKG